VHYYAALDKGHRVKPLPSTKWSFNAVSTLLRNPSLAALMSHDRKLVYDEHGAPVSCGQGIVTMGERVRILAEMERRSTTVQEARDSTRVGKRTGRGRPPKYLLTGFVRCAHCHSALQRMTTRSGGYSSTGYVCSGRKKGTGCSGSQINAETLELEVVTRFTKRLAACEPGDPLLPVIAKRWMAQALPESETDRRRLEDALAVVSQTISDLWDDRYERHMFQTDEDVAEWQRRLDKARKQRDAIREQKDALGPRPEVDIGALLDTELSEEAWKETPLARKRELLGLAVNAVLVLGAKNGQRPARDRIVMVWGHESLPDPLPQDEAPVDARKIIAQLIAEERAGKRPHLTGKEAAEIVGVIQPRWASILLKEQRAKQAAPDSPVE
jgi:site-specific DNA recombinase